MKVGIPWSVFVLITVFVAGCSPDEGPDAITSHTSDAAGSLTECTDCHLVATATRRQIVGSQGDFGANTGNQSHHIAGSADPTTAQCEVCHDQSTHMTGTVLLKNADTGAPITYDPADPSTLEPFCLSCHDALGATSTFIGATALDPFGDGRTLDTIPNVAGNKIDGYWNNPDTIHKDNGLTCAGTGEPATGCHGSNGTVNMHGSASQGLLTKNMNFLIPLTFDSGNPPNTFVYDNYRLCFDCHDNYPAVTKEVVLGYAESGNYNIALAPSPYYTSGIQTLFRDRYIPPPSTNYPGYWGGVSPLYNDNNAFFGDPYMSLHNYHLLGSDISGFLKLSWRYRGDSSQVGRITCTSCHNVHGTAGTVASTFDEFGITLFVGLGLDEYKGFADPNSYNDSVMKTYPINCAVSCHDIMGPTFYWHTPSGE